MTGSPFTSVVWVGSTLPSINSLFGQTSSRNRTFTKAKRKWQTLLGTLLMAEALPRGLSRVEATAVLSFPTRRRRDEGNFRALLEKALGDALVEGGWLADDTADQFRFGAIYFEIGEPMTELTLRCEAAAPAASDRHLRTGHGTPTGHGRPGHG
jgi:hypothetical protein